MKEPLALKCGFAAMLFVAVDAWPSGSSAQGNLTPPPGPPAPTMKSLDQVEPRTPISGIPYTISQSGGYYVTGNLFTTTNGIIIASDNVSIDLNGFMLTGLNNTPNGVDALGSSHTNITIRNGTLSGFGVAISGANLSGVHCSDLIVTGPGTSGVSLGNDALLERITITASHSFGCSLSNRALVIDTKILANGTYGLSTGADSIVRSCLIESNGSTGMSLASAGMVERCVVEGNHGDGLLAADDSHVQACVVRNNFGHGIFVYHSCDVRDCIVTANSQSGIYLFFGGSSIQNNVLRGNNTSGQTAQAGIYADDSNNRIEGNQLYAHTGAAIVANPPYVGNVIVRNTLGQNGSNIVTWAGNDVGPVGSATNSTSPWANIVH